MFRQAKNENLAIEFNAWFLQEPFDSQKAEDIRPGIGECIRQYSVTLVHLSDKTTNSKWLDWEIRESIAMGKGCCAGSDHGRRRRGASSLPNQQVKPAASGRRGRTAGLGP